MTIEAYRIAATMGLNIDPTIAGLNETIAAFGRVLEAQKSVEEMQRNITASILASATAARDFANQMERAAGAGQNMASAAASAGGVAAAAATAQQIAAQRTPGSGLVYVGPGTQWDDARGARGNFSIGSGYGRTGGSPLPPPTGPAGFSGGGPGAPGGPLTPMGSYPGGMPLNAPPGGWPNQQRDPFPTGDLLMGAYGLNRAGNAARGFLADALEPTSVEQGLEKRLAQQWFTPEQVQAAYAAAAKAQQEAMGTYVNDNMRTVLQLMALTQNASASLDELPLAARASSVMSGLGRNGPEELNAVLRSAELRGLVMKEGEDKPDIEGLNKFIRLSENLVALSGGTKGATDLLQFLISSKYSGSMLSEKSTAGMMALINAVGAAQAGTAVSGFAREFDVGKMSKGVLQFLTEMNIVQNPNLARPLSMGYVQLLPGAMGDGDMKQAMSDPAGFTIDRVLPAVRDYLTSKYGATYTNADERTKQQMEQVGAAKLGSTVQAGTALAEFIRLAPLMLREERAAEAQAKKGDPYDTVVAGNLGMEQMKLAADINAAMLTFGKTNLTFIIEGIKAASAAVRALNQAMNDNPSLAYELFAIAGALAFMGTVASGLMITLLPFMAIKNMKAWLASGGPGPGGPAGAALGTAEGIGAAGAGAVLKRFIGPVVWGLMAKGIVDYLDPNQGVDAWADKHIPGYGWFDRKMNHLAGVSDEEFDKARGNTKNGDLTVNVNVDGQKLTSHVIKGVVDAANGPQTGRGDVDNRRLYTQTEN